MDDPYAPIEAEPTGRSPLPRVLAIVAALLLVVGIVVVAAGKDDASKDPMALLSAAPDAVQDAGTARMVMTTTIDGAGMDMTMDGEGLVDFRNGNSTFEMSMMGFSFEMRMVDMVMYMRMPAAGASGVTAKWLGVPIETTAGTSNPFAQVQSGTAMIDALRAAGNEITELGTEEVNGVDATGYRVIIDMEKAVEMSPEDERAAMQAQVEQMRAAGMSEWPMDVWLSDSGLPVRMAMEMDLAGASMKMRMDYLDFGTDAVIDAPPEAETQMLSGMTEMQELLGGAFSESGSSESQISESGESELG